MKCSSCKQELRVIKGGLVSDIDSTEIKTVNIYGCFNKKCDMSMKEQHRTVTTNSSFTEGE